MLYRISFVILLLLCDNSFAHTRSQSFSKWHINQDQVQLTISVLSREVTRLAADESIDVTLPLEQIFINHLTGKLNLNSSEQACTLNAPLNALPSRNGYIRLESSFSCTPASNLEISWQGMFDMVPSHLHYAHIVQVDGSSYELVISDARRTQSVYFNEGPKSLWETSTNYIELGIEHILIGLDHLTFLLALLLLCSSVRQVLILVTGFTLGHSLTLTLSVLGWLQPNTITIEALIGFSIALVVLENLQRQGMNKLMLPLLGVFSLLILAKMFSGFGLPSVSLVGLLIFSLAYLKLVKGNDKASLQFMLTLAFGFIHGFGFAEVLREIGLPASQLGVALFSFNIGVEIGQIFVLCLIAPLMYWINKKASAKFKALSFDACLALVFFMGCYWFISRSLSFSFY